LLLNGKQLRNNSVRLHHNSNGKQLRNSSVRLLRNSNARLRHNGKQLRNARRDIRGSSIPQ
jgi:hypothetical protein